MNPDIPQDTQEQALRTIQRIQSPELITNNKQFHRYLTDGVPVQYRAPNSSGQVGGTERSDYVWLIDFSQGDRANVDNNEFLF